MKELKDVKGLIDQALGWIRWGTGALLTLALLALVVDYMGLKIPVIPTGSEIKLAYLAGIYWLTR